jgi:FtsZ-binding cell division protein ZapB
MFRQELLAEEIAKEAHQVKMLEDTLSNTNENFEQRIAFFERLVRDAAKVLEESRGFIMKGREKSFLEATVNKFEVEREKSFGFIEDLQYEVKTLTEKLNKANTDYDYNLKRIKGDYESLYKEHNMLKQKHFELINSTTQSVIIK